MSNSCRSYYECINEIISKEIGSANEFNQKCVEIKRLKILNDLTDNNKFSVIRINKKDHVNRIAISIITFKYAFILLVTIILISYLFFYTKSNLLGNFYSFQLIRNTKSKEKNFCRKRGHNEKAKQVE